MKTARIALLGNPNCGKSTLCNALTGSKLRVGNWPGVTVERKSGYFQYQDWRIEVVDLPGVYSLTTISESSIDSRIACEAILSDDFDLILNVIDASNLERNLYLTTQLLSLQTPVMLAANMLDVAGRQGRQVDLSHLQQCLGCPITGIIATHAQKLQPLKHALISALEKNLTSREVIHFSSALQTALTHTGNQIAALMPDKATQSRFLALQLLEGDELVRRIVPERIQQYANSQRLLAEQGKNIELDLQIADARYSFAHETCLRVVHTRQQPQQAFSQQLDNIVLHRWLGIPIFLAVMYALFFFSINLGGVFQPFFDGISNAVFVHGFSQWLLYCHAPGWLVGLLGVGIGSSINTVVTFIPVIGAMFLFLSLLESSGYMARAAFVIDRVMRLMGLPGKSFVPLIVGFGCNVPAILATRTLEHRRDRLLTVMMTPFMSCSARMAIYTVFTAAFFPVGGQNIVFMLYLIGIFMAMLTGFILRKTVLQGDGSSWIIELPPYHLPKLGAILRLTWQRLRQFLFKAGKLIIPICLLVSSLNAIHMNGQLDVDNANSHSLLSALGQKVTPLFAPMGIGEDNWPATVGLLTGVLAKEVVVGTLNTLYTQIGHIAAADNGQTFDMVSSLKAAVASIPQQLFALKDSFSNPIKASAASSTVNDGVYGVMSRYFDGTKGAMAYLLFVLLYFPCVSATAAMVRESNLQWATFSVLWTTALAYGAAVVFYQSATWMGHPFYSSAWIVSILALFTSMLGLIKWAAVRAGQQKLLAGAL